VDASAAKSELRARAIAFRRGLSPGEVRDRGWRMWALLGNVPRYALAQGILVCASFDNEPDTCAVLERAPRVKRVYVPRAIVASRELAIHPYPTELHPSRWGVPEPLPTAPVVAPQEVRRVVDVAVLVGLAFGRGNLVRLGYGAGFFDRFLSAHPVYAIGLCYDELLVDGLPRSEWDVPMHAVVTDRRVLFRV